MEAKLLGAGADEGDAACPDLKVELARKKFLLKNGCLSATEAKETETLVKKELSDNAMWPMYEHFCSHLDWKVDQPVLDAMKAASEKRLQEIDEKQKDCENNMGDEEVRDCMMDRADHLANIGDKEKAWAAYAEVEKKTPSANHKLTIAFNKIRLEILFGNWTDIKQLVDTAKHLCEKGGDWEKKNRLMVYEAVYCLAQRQFKRAAKLFLDSVATFTTNELFSYEQCIFYAVVTALITLPRPDLKKKVVEASEVLTVIHKLPGAQRLLHAFYHCEYNEYFPAFLEVTAALERDIFLSQHVRYFMREARIAVYAQYLASYKSVTIGAMAAAFGVSPKFLDAEVSGFIVTGRLAAKIDKVDNIIETVVSDERHSHYQKLLKQGDLLLNRIQKLSKIVDVE